MPAPYERVLIVGAGAIGCFYGARLQQAGHRVTFLARGEHGRTLAAQGLRMIFPLEQPKRVETVALPEVVTGLHHLGDRRFSLLLVTLKTTQLDDTLASDLEPFIEPNGFAIPLLNGLESEAILARAVQADRVIGAVCFIAADRSNPGEVTIRGGGAVHLAPLVKAHEASFATYDRRMQEVIETFSRAHIDVRRRSILAEMLWQKMLWNAPFNGLCALSRCSAGSLLKKPEHKALVREIMEEVAAVAKAEGVELPPEAIQRSIAITETTFRETLPSMLQDVLAGRPTEASFIQGAVVTRAKHHNIEVPRLRTLLTALECLR